MKKAFSVLSLSVALAACTMPSGTVHNVDDVSFDELKQLLTYQYSSKDSFNYVKPQLNLDVAKKDTAKFEREFQSMYNRLIGAQCNTVRDEINSAYQEYNKHAKDVDMMDGMVKLTLTLGLLANSRTTVYHADGHVSNLAMDYVDTYGIPGLYQAVKPAAEAFYEAFGLDKPDYQAYNAARARLIKAEKTQAACDARMKKHSATLLRKVQAQADICEAHQWFKNYNGDQLQQLCATAVTEDFISRLNRF
ncbi:hypothetical protein [Actinobacillus porcinus]|uniref:hypothetical protein n=1 Tax=Actinobacillus porcinus TaxID=51048 RepID=UPI0023563648|nr:hypothetical protein [Actinobacillus porcinus]